MNTPRPKRRNSTNTGTGATAIPIRTSQAQRKAARNQNAGRFSFVILSSALNLALPEYQAAALRCRTTLPSIRRLPRFPARRQYTRSLRRTARRVAAIRTTASAPTAFHLPPADVPRRSRRRSHWSCLDSVPELFPPPDTAPRTLRSLPPDPFVRVSIQPPPAPSGSPAPDRFP